jgi:hypothetical protein
MFHKQRRVKAVSKNETAASNDAAVIKRLPQDAVWVGLSTLTTRAETAAGIPPSSEGVAFRPTACASFNVIIGRKTSTREHKHPRGKTFAGKSSSVISRQKTFQRS